MTALILRLKLFLFLVSSQAFCQVWQINTNTTENLRHLSVIGNTVLICGQKNYLAQCDADGTNLVLLVNPSPPDYVTKLQRLDSNHLFLLSYNPNQSLLFKSVDGGKNWEEKLDTTGHFTSYMSFFDASEGLITKGQHTIRTKDGGTSWQSGPSFNYLGIEYLEIGLDSMVCVAGIGINGSGLQISHDRGHTWPYYWGSFATIQITDAAFLDTNTLFCTTYPAGIISTFNGGKSWAENNLPLTHSFGVCFKNKNEGYVLGANSQSIGVILKTIDMGNSWASFNTGFKTTLMNIAFITDSTALVSGTDGVLLKWNYKNSIFTSVNANQLNSAGFKMFPNPVKDKINFEFNKRNFEKLNLNISNTLGQIVYSKNNIDLEDEFDISFLNSGVYYLKLESLKGQKVFKVVKE